MRFRAHLLAAVPEQGAAGGRQYERRPDVRMWSATQRTLLGGGAAIGGRGGVLGGRSLCQLPLRVGHVFRGEDARHSGGDATLRGKVAEDAGEVVLPHAPLLDGIAKGPRPPACLGEKHDS